MKFHHVDRPRVARELRHHLASSQIPELGQSRWRSGPGLAPLLPALPLLLPELSSHRPPSALARLGTRESDQEGGEDPACV